MAWRGLLPVVCLLILILGMPAPAQRQPTFTTVDARLAGGSNGYGTEVIAMNPVGVATGFYVGYDNIVHAYVRTPDGKLTPFDGQRCTSGQTTQCVPYSLPDSDDPLSPPDTWPNYSAPGTFGTAIDAMGTVTGYYVDANGVAYGYLRAPHGAFTSFSAPGAGTQAGAGTFSSNINLEGVISGYYVDGQWGSHGFVRTRDGVITPFDAPGGIGTTWTNWGQCINMAGAVTGGFFDSNGLSDGFVRNPDGKFETFAWVDSDQNQDLSAWSGEGTNIYAINAAGITTGSFEDANGVYHGLVRTADGKMLEFDAPRAPAGANTIPEAINDQGTVVGFYNDANGVHHGFLRFADGRFAYFDDPAGGDQFHQGTVPQFIVQNTVAGFYEDNDYVWHGFVWNGALDWK
jgi:probable HAF family extracellular repeat protein